MLAILLLAIVACTKEPTPDPVYPGGGGGGGSSGGGSTGSAPSAPTSLWCEPQMGYEVKVCWNSVSNATSYKVYWSNNDDIDSYIQIKTTSSTSIYFDATSSNYNYFRIKAVNSYGESPMSWSAHFHHGGKSDIAPSTSGS